MKAKAASLSQGTASIVELNVGGRKFHFYRSNVERFPDSLLLAWIESVHPPFYSGYFNVLFLAVEKPVTLLAIATVAFFLTALLTASHWFLIL